MAEEIKDINLNELSDVRQSDETAKLEATRDSDGGVVKFGENLLLKAMGHEPGDKNRYDVGYRHGKKVADREEDKYFQIGFKEGKNSTNTSAARKVEVVDAAETESPAESSEMMETDGYPKEATWKDANVQVIGKIKDQDVCIISFEDEAGGTKITAVPSSELIYPEPETETDILKAQIKEELSKEFEDRLTEMEARFQAREQELLSEIDRLKAELAAAKGEIPASPAETTDGVPEKAIQEEFPMGSRIMYMNKKGELVKGTIAGHEKAKDGTQMVQVTNIHADYLWFRPEQLREWNIEPLATEETGEPDATAAVEIPAEPEETTVETRDGTTAVIEEEKPGDTVEKPVDIVEKPAKKRWWQRVKDAASLRTPLIWWQTRGTPYAERTYTEKEVIDQRRGRRLGVFALGAAAGIAAWELVVEPLLFAKHGIHTGGATEVLKHHHKDHMEFINHAQGHRLTAIELPHGWHTAHDAQGHEILKQGNDVLLSHSDLPHGFLKTDGTLSEAAVAHLREMGRHVTYERMQNAAGGPLYKSIIS